MPQTNGLGEFWRSILRALQNFKNRSFERSGPTSRETDASTRFCVEKLHRTNRFSASGALLVTGYVDFAQKRLRCFDAFVGEGLHLTGFVLRKQTRTGQMAGGKRFKGGQIPSKQTRKSLLPTSLYLRGSDNKVSR